RTVCTGLSEAKGSWKISWTCLTYLRKDRPRPAFTAVPPSSISPAVSGYSGDLSRRLDEAVSGPGFEALNRLGTRVPRLVPPITRFAARAMSSRTWTDHAYRIFASVRDVRFHEGEFAIPRAHAAEALRELRKWIDAHGEPVSFPLEVRFTAADDIWLSTAQGRESCYIAFHQYHRMPYRRYFDACQKILGSYGGRPHWGKMHDLGAEELRPRYERFDDFVALRNSLDPSGVLSNPYLDRVLGAPPAAG
ncbi:D-arabinono-1,4-lactone oxidase, partial [Streptomyces roseolus]|uniref:D-arabinono-1,4-lactone oxidase n=1 Tax=Streptomyces roseolus TaxID=67358 RepID=UPI0036515A65